MSEVRGDRPEDRPPERPEPRYGYREDSAWAWWWWVLGIIIIGLIVWWIVAAATPGYQRVATRPSAGETGATGGRAAAATATIPAILSNPNQYLGRAVSVRGLAGQMVGTNAFVLQSQSTGGGATGQGVLVYGQGQVMQSVQPGQSFQVTGTVQRFNAAAMQRVTGRQASLQQFRNWQNQPAIQASAVTTLNPPSGQRSEH